MIVGVFLYDDVIELTTDVSTYAHIHGLLIYHVAKMSARFDCPPLLSDAVSFLSFAEASLGVGAAAVYLYRG